MFAANVQIRGYSHSSSKIVECGPAVRPIVLIVEDEPWTRLSAAAMFQDAGYDILEAVGADEAIRILEGRIDVGFIFTDVEMPGSMDGLKLAFAVRDRWPFIRIVVTSGHHHLHASDLPLGGQFIAKPYEPLVVIHALRSFRV
jgi:CheY-like chemotaxis protein